MKIRNKHLKAHIEQNVEHGAFNNPSKSYLRQKEQEELKAIQQAYNNNNRFKYYNEDQQK